MAKILLVPSNAARDGIDACTVQTGVMLSVRWWSYAADGGLHEIMILRLVVKHLSWSVIARANGCHLPSENNYLAKVQMGFVCFDAALEHAARLLNNSWTLCGGYALSRLMRAQTANENYRFVEGLMIESDAIKDRTNTQDTTWEWGDADFFLTSSNNNYSKASLRKEGNKAIQTVKQSLAKIAGCFLYEDSAKAYNEPGYKTLINSEHTTAQHDDLLSLPNPRRPGHLVIRDITPIGLLLHRTSSIQFIMSSRPKVSPLKQVLAFDMTQCAMWIESIERNSTTGQFQVKLGAPCHAWLQATLAHKGSCIREPYLPMQKRLLKYQQRGYEITVHCKLLHDALRSEWRASRSLQPPEDPCVYTYVNVH